MRDYAVVSPKFWTGETGKQITQLCRDNQDQIYRSVATYLMTCPTSNMIGLYYLPLPTLCHEIGCPIDGALIALRGLSEIGFAFYDTKSEVVWVPGMPAYQLGMQPGTKLKTGDTRIKRVQKLYDESPNCPFLRSFYDRWVTYLLLQNSREYVEKKPLKMVEFACPIDAPSMPHRCQDQEQDQEQDNKKGIEPDGSAHFTPPSMEMIAEASGPKIKADLEQMAELLYKKKVFPDVFAWKNKALKQGKNERAVLHALKRCQIKAANEGLGRASPWAYCTKIINVESGNYNEAEYRKTC